MWGPDPLTNQSMNNSDSAWALGALILAVLIFGVLELEWIHQSTRASVSELQQINVSNEQFNQLYQESI